MKKIDYKMHKRNGTPPEDVTGYDCYPFGIRKESDYYIIDHIPTGFMVTTYVKRLKDAVAIIAEIKHPIWRERAPEVIQAGIPEEIQRYLAYGLRCSRGGFMFRTLDQFREEYS